MSTEDQFIDRVKRELRLLSRREDELAKREEVIRRERAAIRARTTELSRVMTLYESMMGPPTVEASDAETVPIAESAPIRPSAAAPVERSDGTDALTTADLSATIMAAQGGRAKIRELLDELVRVGKLPGNEGDYGSVYNALKRHPNRFVKTGPGEFALVGSTESKTTDEPSEAT